MRLVAEPGGKATSGAWGRGSACADLLGSAGGL